MNENLLIPSARIESLGISIGPGQASCYITVALIRVSTQKKLLKIHVLIERERKSYYIICGWAGSTETTTTDRSSEQHATIKGLSREGSIVWMALLWAPISKEGSDSGEAASNSSRWPDTVPISKWSGFLPGRKETQDGRLTNDLRRALIKRKNKQVFNRKMFTILKYTKCGFGHT